MTEKILSPEEAASLGGHHLSPEGQARAARDAEQAPTKTGALIAKCRHAACGYGWIVAFLPMPVLTAGKLGMHAACPKCGDPAPRHGSEVDLDQHQRDHLRRHTSHKD